MDPVTGAVIIAGLTTVAKPSAAALTAIVSKILSPSADAAGEWIAAPLQALAKRRGELATKTLLKAAEILQESKVEPQSVHGRVLWPILEHASLEQDDQLHLKWAALLANAASGTNQVPPSFASILAELSPAEAEIVDLIFMEEYPGRETWSVSTTSIQKRPEFKETFLMMMDNLARLGLIRPTINYDLQKEAARNRAYIPAGIAAPTYDNVRLTSLGDAFVIACYPPRVAERKRSPGH